MAKVRLDEHPEEGEALRTPLPRRSAPTPPIRVYKVGGPALVDPAITALLAREMRSADERSVLVHGGGRQVDALLRSLGIECRFVDGRRITSPAAMEVVEMVLSGAINKALAAALTKAGVASVGLSGRDGGLIRARLQPGLGCVGVPVKVRAQAIFALWGAGFVPVVSPVSSGPSGEAANVNADEAALALATALSAQSLIYLSDVDGVRVDTGVVDELDGEQARSLLRKGVIAGGMALKVRVALGAAEAGIPEVVVAGLSRLQGGFKGTRIVGRPQEVRA